MLNPKLPRTRRASRVAGIDEASGPREVVGAPARLVGSACADANHAKGAVANLVGERLVDPARERHQGFQVCFIVRQFDDEVGVAEPVPFDLVIV